MIGPAMQSQTISSEEEFEKRLVLALEHERQKPGALDAKSREHATNSDLRLGEVERQSP